MHFSLSAEAVTHGFHPENLIIQVSCVLAVKAHWQQLDFYMNIVFI